jgi:hypothetical protein
MKISNQLMEERAYVWDETGTMLITHQLTAVLDIKRILAVMQRIMGSRSTLFEVVEVRGHRHIKSSSLGKQLLLCLRIDTQLIDRQFPSHRHSPLYLLFKRYTRSFRLAVGRMFPEDVEGLNLAVTKMRAYKGGVALRRHLDNLRRSERGNAQSCAKFLQGLRSRYSKVLAIRLDLEYYSNYRVGVGFESQAISLEEAQQHRDTFINYLRKGPLAKHFVGYVWKLEYGLEKGYHFHFGIFFDGQKVCKDITIGDLLGQQWREAITRGRGMFFSCNKKKEAYLRCGIGMLLRSDDVKWQALEKAMRYLTKVDLYLRFRSPGRKRTFGLGRVLR